MIYIIFILISINNLYKYNQIMQQQFYEIRRYLKIIKKQSCVYDFILLLLSIIVYIANSKILFYMFLLILLIYNFPRTNKSIIKLKITKRIVRMYLIQLIMIIMYSYLVNQMIFEFQSVLIGVYSFLFGYLYLVPFIIGNIVELIIREKYLLKAKRKLNKYNPRIIAVTGSFGKTSTKEYLLSVLSSTYRVIGTPKSYNTLLGITSFINNSLNDYYDYLILEVGVDKKNGMNKFLKLFTPDISVVTGLAPQHLSTFKTIENIANEKLKLANAAKDKAFINGDFELLKKENKKYYYCHSEDIKLIEKGFEYKNAKYLTNLFGSHLFINLAIVIEIAKYLKVNGNILKEEIKKITNAKHRFECFKNGNNMIIDDSYNSNLYSFSKALDSLSKIDKYKIIITPGLIELENKSYEYNAIVAKKCLEVCDKIYLVGNNIAFKEILKSTEKLETFSSFNDAYKNAILINVDKVILIENDLPDIFIE